MLVYNVTIGIDKDVEEEWLQWTRAKHVPTVMATGLFIDSTIYKILHDQEDGSVSYSIQYKAETIQHIQEYLEQHAPAIFAELRQRYSHKHVAFQTVLEQIQ